MIDKRGNGCYSTKTMAIDFLAAALRSAIRVTSSIFEDTPKSMTTTPSYKSEYNQHGKTVYEDGLIKKYDHKDNLISVERDPNQTTRPKSSSTTTEKNIETVKVESGNMYGTRDTRYDLRIVYENGRRTEHKRYSAASSSSISEAFDLKDFKIITLKPQTVKVEVEYGWIREYDAKNTFVCSTKDPEFKGYEYDKDFSSRNYRSSPTGSYSSYSSNGEWINGKFISYADDPEYPKYDPKIPWAEREEQMKAFREKKAKERKLEKIRQKKDSPTLLSDMIKELKIDNKTVKPDEMADLHIKWQQFLDYHRRTKVPRVKKRIENFNKTYKGKYQAHLCNACAGCLIIPTVSEEGYIYNSQRCGSCNGNGFQIPLIRVGEPEAG